MGSIDSNLQSNEQREQDLEEFRNAWKQEVQNKHSQDKNLPSLNDKKPVTSQHIQEEEESAASLVEATESLTTNEKDPITAMDHYVIAVDHERQGKLGKALDSYRRAFKLDPNIMFAYKKHYQNVILPSIEASVDKPQKPTEEFKHFIPIGKEYTAPSATRRDPLADLIEQFLSEGDLSYIPVLDYKPVSIAKLPSEIMIKVLKYMVLHSVSSIPYFALVCKKFFLLTRDPSIWQYACIRIFREPSMTLEQSKEHQSRIVEKYDGHWMRMFIDRPRIRYDGVYISTCHYIRPGTSDTAWNQPIHFVIYYRYLRFFPDGTILKHVSTDEPVHVVKLLQEDFNKKQCFHGRFILENDDHIQIVMKDSTLPQETFHLSLNIKTTHRGRHNKLIWDKYSSTTNRPDREDHDYNLKLLKPYYFSPVRSYKVIYPDEFDSSSSIIDDPTLF